MLSMSKSSNFQYRFQYLYVGTAVPPWWYSSTNSEKLQYHRGGTGKVLRWLMKLSLAEKLVDILHNYLHQNKTFCIISWLNEAEKREMRHKN